MPSKYLVSARKPWYNKDDATRRVVSVANGLFQSEVRVAERGTRELSNWIALHSPCSFEDAKAQTSFRYGGQINAFVSTFAT